jgi:hypothetical protein
VSAAGQPESRLVIEHWNSLYKIPTDHPAPHDVQQRLDNVVRGDVTAVCRRRLAHLADDGDESVWLIREIRLELALDVSAEMAGQAAEYWGDQLALEIQRAMNDGADGTMLLRFANRAEYIAQWARDMAAGQAWGNWYYAEFEGLRSLSTSAAMAEGIVREPGEAARVLQQIAKNGGLEQVCAALHDSDAAKIYRAAARDQGVDPAAEERWVMRVVELMRRVPLSTTGDDGHDALRLYAAAKEQFPGAEEGGLSAAVAVVVAWHKAVTQMPSERVKDLRNSLASNDRDTAVRLLRSACASLDDSGDLLVARIAEGKADWATVLATAVENPEGVKPEAAFLTEFGGVFLLGRAILDLSLHEALECGARRSRDPEYAAAILRLILAIHCLGRARAGSSPTDAAVLWFAGLECAPSLGDMSSLLAEADIESAFAHFSGSIPEERRELLADLEEAQAGYFAIGDVFPELGLEGKRAAVWVRLAAAVLRLFARRLPGFARSSPEYLFQNFLAGTSSVRCSGARVEVRLPHCPLSVVLQIAGAYGSYELPWRKGVEICLRAPSA